MTVQELMDRLQRLPPDTEVVVSVNVPYDSVGPRPSANVTHASAGFDWEQGTVILSTDGNLVKFNDDQYAAFNDMKKEARLIRRQEWNKRDRTVTYEESKELVEKIDEKVHPLLRGSYKKD